jgi:uncharacterized phosphatase
MKLYFVRHGETNTNANLASSLSIDEPLNSLGIQQAKELAEELKDVKFDAFISSPLKRALQTAELINKYNHGTLKVDKMWRERDAKAYADISLWNDIFDFDKNVQIDGQEPLREFFERVYAAIEDLKREYKDKTVLLVSHGGVQHALYAYANKLPWTGNMRIKPMKNCECRIFDL